MSPSVSITPSNAFADSSPAPTALDGLMTMPLRSDSCPRRTRQQLDLILLAIEALDLGGSEAILYVAQELDLQAVLKNRVNLWQLRSTNPLRRYTQRRPLTQEEAKTLVVIICYIARRLTVVIRQLLLAEQQLREKGLPLDQNFRLDDYLTRFRVHFRQRMNPRRTAVSAYSSNEKLDLLALSLLRQLLFCTGTSGSQRLWTSLFDGEV